MSHTPKAAHAIVKAWNRTYLPGAPVIFINDSGEECHTVTRTEAYLIDGARTSDGALPVIMIKGKSGCVSLARVIPYQPIPASDTELDETESERTTVRVFMRDGECEDAFARDQHPDVRIEVEVYVREDNRSAYKDAHTEATDNTQDWMTIPYRQ